MPGGHTRFEQAVQFLRALPDRGHEPGPIAIDLALALQKVWIRRR